MNDSPPGLLPHHLRELRASGLTDETIKAAGVYSETQYVRLAALLNWRRFPKRMAPALVFPFRGPDGSNGYYRIKPDLPRKDPRGKPVKYESPKSRANEIYLPPGVADLLDRSDGELLLTEGEKKALAATQAGLSCIGLVGVYGWKEGKSERLLPSLERITWSGRQVRIVFDSDAADNPQVLDGEARLAKHLVDRGAIVRVVRLPAGAPQSDGKPTKVGLDDFLVAHGAGALRKLLDSAEEPEPLSGAELKAPASEIDPAEEARMFLESSVRDDLPLLRFHRGSFVIWRKHRYCDLPHSEVRGRLIRFLNHNYRKLTGHVTSDVLDQLRAQGMLSGDVEPPCWLGEFPRSWSPQEMLAAQNALIHLPSLVRSEESTLDPSPRFFSRFALDYDFRIDAPRPDGWLTFLEQLWPHDRQSVEVVQEWFGYCLTVDTSQQKMLVLIGLPRSGKGTIARVLSAVIGPTNVAGPTFASLATNFGLSPLIGKSLAVINDARLSGRSDQAVVIERLLSISGEDAQTVDRKFLEPWTGKLTTRWMIISNELPRLNEVSGALVGRMILLRLTESFYDREDSALTAKLIEERPGILLWAIEGWRRLRERGRFVQPESASEFVREMSDLASPVGHFIRERCVVGPGCRVAIDELYAEWKRWCEVNGRKEPGTVQIFGRDLLAVVPTLKLRQPRDGERRYRVYEGIGLRADAI